MLLCIDIGNTNIVLGLYQEDRLGQTWRVATRLEYLADEYAVLVKGLFQLRQYDLEAVDGICLSSVVPPLTSVFREVCTRYFGKEPLVVDAGVKTGVKIRYDSPRDVGADRVVDAAAVLHEYGVPACIVDFGTATTFDALNDRGEYLGGAIAPGMGIAAESLFSRTAKLPRVELLRPPRTVGSNTVQAIQSGLLFGYVALVEGMIRRFRRELGQQMRVIGTGGMAQTIASETEAIQVVDPWLTLKGLHLIWNMNRSAEGEA